MQRIQDYLVVAIAALSLTFTTACDDTAASGDGDNGAAGGASAAGGSASGAGGMTGMGGTPDTGGSAGMGGAPSAGGAAGMGGMPGTGGTPPMGGTPPPACDATSALADTAAGDLAPATVINSLELPSMPARADELGCDIVDGSNNGTGLTGLLRLLQLDIASLVTPDEEGNTDVILLGHLDGWNAGETSADASDVKLILYTGDADGDGYTISNDSFVDNDRANAPKIQFDADLSNCQVNTNPGNFEFSVPVLDTGLNLGLTLSATTVSGDLRAEATGFSMQKSTINGYLRREAIVALLEGVLAACNAPNPPSFCAQAAMFLGGDAEMTVDSIVLPILRGLDSKVNAAGDAVEGNCMDAADCNAVSVCLAFESIPATLTGYSE